MIRSEFTLAMSILCAGAISCSSTSGKGTSSARDPFIGFFAHPSTGMLELQRGDAEGEYRGSMWADFGPFPVQLTRDGNVARGTVTYGGAIHPLQVEHTAQGLVLTADGTQAEAPLQRYKNMKAYQKWFEAQGGYRAQGSVDEPPSRGSATAPATQAAEEQWHRYDDSRYSADERQAVRAATEAVLDPNRPRPNFDNAFRYSISKYNGDWVVTVWHIYGFKDGKPQFVPGGHTGVILDRDFKVKSKMPGQ